MSLALYYLRLTIPPERVISLLESQWSMLTDLGSFVYTRFMTLNTLSGMNGEDVSIVFDIISTKPTACHQSTTYIK